MADGASLYLPACLPVAADSDSPLIAAARAAFGALSDAQRLAFVTETVRDIRDIHCRLQLGRLIRVAEATASELAREAMLRGRL